MSDNLAQRKAFVLAYAAILKASAAALEEDQAGLESLEDTKSWLELTHHLFKLALLMRDSILKGVSGDPVPITRAMEETVAEFQTDPAEIRAKKNG